MLSRRPDAVNWAAKEVICHLRDLEEVFMLRFHMMLGTDEPPFLVVGEVPPDPERWGIGGRIGMPLDPDRWAAERQYLRNDAGLALHAFRMRREESLTLLVLPNDRVPADSVDGRRLATEPLVVIAPRAARLPGALDLATLGQALDRQSRGCSFRSLLRQALAAAGQPLRVAAEVEGTALHIDLVAVSLGLALVPIHALRGHAARQDVQILPVAPPFLAQAVWFLVGRVAPPLTAPVDFLQNSLPA